MNKKKGIHLCTARGHVFFFEKTITSTIQNIFALSAAENLGLDTTMLQTTNITFLKVSIFYVDNEQLSL
jgi:hypothetical protein